VGGDLRALVTRKASDLEVADAPCDVLLSSTGLLARTPVHEGETQPGGRRHRHDVIVSTARSSTRGRVGLLTSGGRLVRVNVLDIPEVPTVTTGAISLRGGASAAEFLALDRGERVLGLASLREDGPGLALATRQGVVKRVSPEGWPARGEAVDVITLKPGDEVVGAVELPEPGFDLVLITSDAQLLRFPAAGVRPQGRSAGGMAGIRVAVGARVVFFGALDPDREGTVVTVSGSTRALPGTEAGSVKATPFAEYPAKGRGTGGVRCHRFLRGEDTLILAWAGAAPARAAAATGVPVALPEAQGRRDGSGSPGSQPIAAVGGA
jgi:DNA gyrase subunit A